MASVTAPEAKMPKPLEKLGKPRSWRLLLNRRRIAEQKYASCAQFGYPFLHFASAIPDIAAQ
jgi:hypothetical protein